METLILAAGALCCWHAGCPPDGFSLVAQVNFFKRVNISQVNQYTCLLGLALQRRIFQQLRHIEAGNGGERSLPIRKTKHTVLLKCFISEVSHRKLHVYKTTSKVRAHQCCFSGLVYDRKSCQDISHLQGKRKRISPGKKPNSNAWIFSAPSLTSRPSGRFFCPLA